MIFYRVKENGLDSGVSVCFVVSLGKRLHGKVYFGTVGGVDVCGECRWKLVIRGLIWSGIVSFVASCFNLGRMCECELNRNNRGDV